MKGLWNINFNDPRLALKRTPISDIEIEAQRSAAGGLSRDTLARWGVPWPPLSGWRKALLEYGVPLLPIDTTSNKTMRRTSKTAWALLAQLEQKPISKLPAKMRRSLVPKDAREKFYLSWDWRTLRMDVLKERGRRCECCGATPSGIDMAGKPVKLCVDHIKPLSRYWHLRLDKTNLQILCDECNQGKGAWDETDWRRAS